jgi:hypothetical protein
MRRPAEKMSPELCGCTVKLARVLLFQRVQLPCGASVSPNAVLLSEERSRVVDEAEGRFRRYFNAFAGHAPNLGAQAAKRQFD